MITQIMIQQPGYQDFALSQLTDNNILIFSSAMLKDKVAAEVEKIWLLPDGGGDSVIYAVREAGEELGLDMNKKNIRSLPTTVAHLKGGQKFVFTTEAAFLYAAKDWYDIWFVVEVGGQIACHAFCEFIGAKGTWEEGPDAIYANFVNGQYGCYGGYKKHNKGEYTWCRE